MQKVSDLFSANAFTPCQVATLENGNAGFRVPEYQRPYDWSITNVERLMSDIFSGFERLSQPNTSAFTFLGTLILMRDGTQEERFRGQSFSIVDGQQRITTLALLSCALIQQLRKLNFDRPKLSNEIENWLKVEADHLEYQLGYCIYGNQIIKGNTLHAFPRIVRGAEDYRSDDEFEEMRSAIAMFLRDFYRYICGDDCEYEIPYFQSREGKKIIENYKKIQNYLESLNDPHWYDDKDCRFLESKRFQCSTKLWEKSLDVFGDGDKVSNAIRKVINSEFESHHHYFRTLMLLAYFSKCIVVTTVITTDETAAFDIFDALNTTGEPLTALEVLKPQVISYLGKGYKGSPCDLSFIEIDKIMQKDYPDTRRKMAETKELVISFSMYLEGLKVSKELGEQRKVLRQFFEQTKKTQNGPEKFMNALENVARYRSDYWVKKNNGRIDNYHADHKQADEVKLLSSFIADMKTSLTIPILSRYWIVCRQNNDFFLYFEVLKAVVAFLAIRRAATGGTDSIDTCFRDIMESGTGKKCGLSSGPNHQNDLLALDEIRLCLRSKLNSSKVRFETKEEWIRHVVDNPMYDNARPLVRFLLFGATHHAIPDKREIGLLTRDDIAQSDNRNYLTYDRWAHKDYLTVEHVAPISDKTDGWDQKIYHNPRLKNTLGNLVLLPTEENTSISNAPWSKKKIFYSLLTEFDKEQRRLLLDSANKEGMEFNENIKKMIDDGKRLSMLDGIQDVSNWDAMFIEKRSHRLASLAWDKLSPWLGMKNHVSS